MLMLIIVLFAHTQKELQTSLHAFNYYCYTWSSIL